MSSHPLPIARPAAPAGEAQRVGQVRTRVARVAMIVAFGGGSAAVLLAAGITPWG